MESGSIATKAASGLRYDPDWWKIASQAEAPPQPELDDVFKLRAFAEELVHGITRREPYPDAVEETKTELDSPDGSHKFTVSRFATAEQRAPPEEGEPPRPAVLYLHGGGMVSCTVETVAPAIARGVAATGVQYFAVDYPLAPEFRAPAAVDDVYAALQWLSRGAAGMHVDPARIAVMGDSAGGGLAAGAVLMARDRGLSPPVAKQVLVCPMLDDRTRYPDAWPLLDFVTWTARDNDLAWDAYLGAENRGKPGVSVYAAPGRIEDAAGLPRTYIEVGGLDLFRDEDMRYALKLAEANVEVEFHLYPGVPHGFEGGVGSQVVTKALEGRIRAVQTV